MGEVKRERKMIKPIQQLEQHRILHFFYIFMVYRSGHQAFYFLICMRVCVCVCVHTHVRAGPAIGHTRKAVIWPQEGPG